MRCNDQRSVYTIHYDTTQNTLTSNSITNNSTRFVSLSNINEDCQMRFPGLFCVGYRGVLSRIRIKFNNYSEASSGSETNVGGK